MKATVIELVGSGDYASDRRVFLKSFDPEFPDGRGRVQSTTDPREAMRFADHRAAAEFWQTQSHVRPLRPDGQPNRPLSAETVLIDEVEL